jgi:uncharacterized protein (TIGR00369 family)
MGRDYQEFLRGGFFMKKVYSDLQSLVTDGLLRVGNRPQCVLTMQPEFVEYVEGESITYAYPVLPMYANPRQTMQGGFMAAAFDNAFGALVSLTTKRMDMASIDLELNYHRPIMVGDKLIIKVYIKSLGKTIVHLTGDAYDSQQNLVSSATTNIYLLNNKKDHQTK